MDFSHYTVLDLSWLLPGPYGTMLLSDLGMEVIKIERPEQGDYSRWLPPEVGDSGLSHLFHTVNRGKKSVTIDLSEDEGIMAFHELAAEADAVFEQFRPGVVDRLGVCYEDIREVNEDIIYCSLSGYGQDGPYRNRVGHDINYAAIAGLLDKTKSRDGEFPAQPGYPVGDMGGGLVVALSIIIGLLQRELGGGGQYFDVSMTDVVLSLATSQEWLAEAEAAGEDVPTETLEPPAGMVHPCHNVFRTKDGKFVTFAAVEEKFWKSLLEELDREDLLEYQYAGGEDGKYATQELQAEFEKYTRGEWEERLSDEIPFAPVNEFGEVFDHPQVQAREMVQRKTVAGEEMTQLGFPVKSSEGIEESTEPGPALGEHTRDVLERALPSEEVNALLEDGVVTEP
jgi:crotonobetainyl-CoA:carnitine CoA-transferase CaiB-like acyl-CoA transferase